MLLLSLSGSCHMVKIRSLTNSGAGNIHLHPDGERGRDAKGGGGGGMLGSVIRSLSRAKNGERRKD